jgi:nuclear polyadenylated RNA-binding protein 3
VDDRDLQIPKRDPRDVPDVQIILLDELDRGFVGWVEGELRGRGVKVEIMFLSPRLSLEAVIRRQILEGVIAVAQLTRQSQNMSKIPLQVFDRTGGADNVRFDEYQDLEPRIAAERVLREKQKKASVPAFPQQNLQGPPAAAAPNLANLVGQLDNATLQKLLGTLNTVPQQQNAQIPPVQNQQQVDIAALLGGLIHHPAPVQQPSYQAPPPRQDPYGALANNTVQPPMPQSQQPEQQVQNIMAQLARYRQ